MAQDAQTWVSPYRSGIVLVDRIMHSLSEWLMNGATFQNGVAVGNGTPPTYSSTTGAQTAPAPSVKLTSDNVVTGTGSPASPQLRAGTSVVTTDASGIATITYTAFATGVDYTSAQPVDTGNLFSMTSIHNTLSGNGTLAAICRNNAGALLTAASVKIRWLAVGH